MTLEQIFEDIRAKISDVRVAVNRRSAGIHLYVAPGRIERAEFLDLSRIGVKETDWHVCHFVAKSHAGRNWER